MPTHRASHNSSQWVPGPLIKPVKEVVEAMLYHMMSGSVVKPGNTPENKIAFSCPGHPETVDRLSVHRPILLD